MSDYTELNSKADAALSEIAEYGARWPEGQDWFEPELCSAGLEFVKASSPNAIKALIAENETMRRGLHDLANLPGLTIRQAKIIRIAMGSGEQP